MTNPMLAELDERLSELKSTLAVMAKYAPAPGVLCAPTMEMGLGWKAKALLPKIEAAHATLADMAKRMEAAERDSKRLDWLEAGDERTVFQVIGGEWCAHDGLRVGKQWFGATLRAALDAAIDATQEGAG